MKTQGLPGITKGQMQEVDRLMMEEYHVPVELMMEHAGLNLARLAVKETNMKYTFQVIAGSGNNGGGGLVAARRLFSWGFKTEVYIPKGVESLRDVPMKQLIRLQKTGILVSDGIPLASKRKNSNLLVLDCYIGYGFKYRSNEISDQVFSYLRNQQAVISLDTPSGLDVTTGVDFGEIKPSATLTIAFLKHGLLIVPRDVVGHIYLVDIGVPSVIYRDRLAIEWSPPFDQQELEKLQEEFSKDSLQRISIHKSVDQNQLYWKVN